MFCTFSTWIITAIFLWLYVTASKCDDDINAASQDVAQCANGIQTAITHCKTHSDQCVAEISSVVEHIEAAKVTMSHSFAGCFAMPRINEDCQDDGRFVGQDFVIIGFKTLEGIEDCALTPSPRCGGDFDLILKAIGDAIVHVDKLTTDCDFVPGSDCDNDLVILSAQLSKAKVMFIAAQTDYRAHNDTYIDDLLLGAADVFDATSNGILAVYYCTNLISRRHEH